MTQAPRNQIRQRLILFRRKCFEFFSAFFELDLKEDASTVIVTREGKSFRPVVGGEQYQGF